jgi:hypothetical protein
MPQWNCINRQFRLDVFPVLEFKIENEEGAEKIVKIMPKDYINLNKVQ